MFSQLFKRQQRPVDDPNNASGPADDGEPVTKKIKTGHAEAKEDPEPALDLVRDAVFSNFALLGTILSYVDSDTELPLAATDKLFYTIYSLRAQHTLCRIHSEADPHQQEAFLRRALHQAVSSLKYPQDRERYLQTEQRNTSWLQTLWTWLKPKPRTTLKSHRYFLRCAYTVPVDMQSAFPFGPSCSYGDRLYFLAASGAVVIMDTEPKTLDIEWTRQGNPGLLSTGYDWIFDELWYCAPNDGQTTIWLFE